METNNNIDRLLVMLDHPERYSEQEIMDIVNHDKETRDFYRQLVRVQRARCLQHSLDWQMDVDEAWRQFDQRYLAQPKQERPWLKMVATIAGILLISVITWAAIHIVNQTATEQVHKTTISTTQSASDIEPSDNLTDSTDTLIEPIVYDNMALEQILGEIAANYGMDVKFMNAEARNLRFHFVWDKADGLDKVLADLNHFERVDIEQKGNQLIVR